MVAACWQRSAALFPGLRTRPGSRVYRARRRSARVASPIGRLTPIVETANVGCVNERSEDIAERPIRKLDDQPDVAFEPRFVRAHQHCREQDIELMVQIVRRPIQLGTIWIPIAVQPRRPRGIGVDQFLVPTSRALGFGIPGRRAISRCPVHRHGRLAMSSPLLRPPVSPGGDPMTQYPARRAGGWAGVAGDLWKQGSFMRSKIIGHNIRHRSHAQPPSRTAVP